jgi:protein-tyrosine phosphatase
MENILILCIGNICRSPMAEGLFKQALPEKAVCSAGIHAMVGEPADRLALQLMREHGIDISEHRAQNLAGWMVNEADLILTMDSEQKRFIERNFATAKGKVWRLGESGDFDIPDPYRHGLAAFRHCHGLIVHAMGDLVEKLSASAQTASGSGGGLYRHSLAGIRESPLFTPEKGIAGL